MSEVKRGLAGENKEDARLYGWRNRRRRCQLRLRVTQCRHFLVEIRARLIQELAHGFLLIVGVGPGPNLEGAGLKAQRNLCKYAVTQIDAMCLVLGRCKQELAELEQRGIEIERPWLRKSPTLGEFPLQFDRQPLHVGRSE